MEALGLLSSKEKNIINDEILEETYLDRSFHAKDQLVKEFDIYKKVLESVQKQNIRFHQPPQIMEFIEDVENLFINPIPKMISNY